MRDFVTSGRVLPASFARASLREKVQDMLPLEALEVVLQAWEDLTGQDSERIAELADRGFYPSEAALYALLSKNFGRTVSYDRIFSVLSTSAGEFIGEKNLQVRVHALRRRLVGSGEEIVTITKVGYRLQAVPRRRSSSVGRAPDL